MAKYPIIVGQFTNDIFSAPRRKINIFVIFAVYDLRRSISIFFREWFIHLKLIICDSHEQPISL